MKKILSILLIVMQVSACNQATKSAPKTENAVEVPGFSADSAYHFVQNQVDFGPRLPNTDAQLACANYLSIKLKGYGAQVIEQKADVKAFNGKTLRSINIIGSYNPKAATRVLLFSHWDSRPWADNDPNPKNHDKPVMGANDGASGVGVLLEIARQMGKTLPAIGVDIIFFDVEDYGAPANYSTQNTEDTWCLGTQYWAKNPHVAGYTAKYGILLDMVGGAGATFFREQVSEQYAANVVDKVWSQAANLGFGQYFVNQRGGMITDDHVYVNQIRGIPSIDIIQLDPQTGGFAGYWHTVDDTMKNVDKNTLGAVGVTLMHVIYNEK